jgi:hypothetical protein
MVDRSDSLAQCDAAQALSERAGRFQQGAKRIYDSKSDHGGDMWFFELFHFLGDVQSAFRSPAVQERLASPGSPERTAELQYEAGMYESLYLAWKERAEQAEAQVEDARKSLEIADKMVSEHIERFHDYDYRPEEQPPELASLHQIEHHLMGSLILDDDISSVSSTERQREG